MSEQGTGSEKFTAGTDSAESKRKADTHTDSVLKGKPQAVFRSESFGPS